MTSMPKPRSRNTNSMIALFILTSVILGILKVAGVLAISWGLVLVPLALMVVWMLFWVAFFMLLAAFS